MKLTEREMTVAIETVAKQLFAGTRPPWRRGGADAAWDELTPLARYERKAAVGEVVLPVLVSLPDREHPGPRRTFTAEEYAEAAESATRTLLENREPGSWELLAEKQRRRQVKVTVALTQLTVEALPDQQDPDQIVVPDHL